MKFANNIKLRVFIKPEEDAVQIEKKFLELLPFDLEKEKLTPEKKTATGFSQKQITIIEITLAKDRHTNSFIRHLVENLSHETKELILRQAESRLDDELNFFLRFDKAKLLEENKFWLTEKGDCFHIKINIASFPRKKERALEIIRKLFK